jgi:hypothetical protein
MVPLDSLKTESTVSFGHYQGGWNIANEEFMSNVKLFSDLKLRASIGTSGNDDRVGDFAFFHCMVVLVELIMALQVLIIHNLQIKITDGSNLNTNLGLDVAFLNNRVRLSVDAYLKPQFDL